MTKTFASLLLPILLAAFVSPASCQEDDRGKIFAEAHALFSRGEFSRARDLFQKTIEGPFALEDHSLYFLGSIALKEGDPDAARRAFSELKERHPLSIWLHRAELEEAKLLLTEKKYDQAAPALRALRSASGGKTEIGEEALFLLAQMHDAQGDLARAYALYQELRDLSPLSRWAAAARAEVARLRTRDPERFALTGHRLISEEARRLAKEREYREAEALYRNLIGVTLDAEIRPRLLMDLADLYLAVRRRSDALPLLDEIVREFPDSAEAPNALYHAARIYWNRNDNLAALGFFTRLIAQYPRSARVDMAYFAAADIYESLGEREEAITFYQAVPQKFPASRLAGDATWRLGWLYYVEKSFDKARATFKSLAAREAGGRYGDAALFWQARAAEKLGDAEEARRLYLLIADGEEESYYRGLAAKRLDGAGAIAPEPGDGDGPAGEAADPPLSAEHAYHLSRARALTRLSLESLATAELDEVRRLAGGDIDLGRLLMREYANNRAFARSAAIAARLPEATDERERHRFPLAYWSAVRRKAEENGLDPYLVLALIRQESLFDPRARSPAAALGLMQMLLSTAARVARQSGLPPPSAEALHQPELNLTLGTRYLKDLLQRHSNDWIKAIAAYNAGENAVARWEREIPTEDAEEFIERIPYVETRLYVKLVLRNHRIYKKLYASPR